MTKTERKKIEKLVASGPSEEALIIIRAPDGPTLFTREASGPEPHSASLTVLEVEPTAWWPRDRVPKRPHEIRRDS